MTEVNLLAVNYSADELAQAITGVIAEKKPGSVADLLALVKERFPLPDKVLLDCISDLESKGLIALGKPPASAAATLTDYLKTKPALWYWVTVIVAALAIAAVFAIPEDAAGLIYVRNILGVLFVLWLPGYAFIKALFPVAVPFKTSSDELDLVERAALSLGMSLALVPIVGLILNYTPWGIRLMPISLSLLFLTLAFATVALFREYGLRFGADAAS